MTEEFKPGIHDRERTVCQSCHAENLVLFLPDPSQSNTFEISCAKIGCTAKTEVTLKASKVFSVIEEHYLAPHTVSYDPPLLPMGSKTEAAI